MAKSVMLSKAEISGLFGSSHNYSSNKYNDVYFSKEKLDSLSARERLDFVHQELKIVGNVDPYYLRTDTLVKVMSVLEGKRLREDFVKIPEKYKDHQFRTDMGDKYDMTKNQALKEQKAQELSDSVRTDFHTANELSQKYYVSRGGNDKAPIVEEPKSLTVDMKELSVQDMQRINEDMDYVDSFKALKFKRDSQIEGKRLAESYRLDVKGVDTSDFIEDSVIDPVETANTVRKMEDILARQEQNIREFPNDIHVRDNRNRTRLFFVPEIKRLRGLLGTVDFTTTAERKETITTLMKSKPVDDMTIDESLAHSDKMLKRFDMISPQEKELHEMGLTRENVDMITSMYGHGLLLKNSEGVFFKAKEDNTVYRVDLTK